MTSKAQPVGQTKEKATSSDVPTSWLVTPDDEQEPRISVVMPTLNEERGLGECVDGVIDALSELEVYGEIIVSDSSTDRTPEIARQLGARVVHPDEPGYGYAYQYAFERVRGEYVVIGDADTTYDFSELPRLLEPVRDGDADMCLGSRLDGEIKDGAMPVLHEYIGNPLLTAFLNTFYDTGVSDAHSGFRVMHRDALDELELDGDGMEFASEMLMEAGAHDLEIDERPIVYHERQGEATLDTFRDGWRHIRFMLVNAPGYLFIAPGVTIGLVGILAMMIAITGIDIGGIRLGRHSLIAGSLFTIVGYQIVAFGAFARVASDPVSEPSDPVTDKLLRHFTLERAATAGFLIFAFGSAYAISLIGLWITSGFSRLPLVAADILSFTAIVIGLQTIFNAFFLSTIETVRE